MYEKLEINPSAVFFHGTDADFKTFDTQYKGSNTVWNNTVHGFFFADKKENAKLFGETIVQANLILSNPIDLRLHSIFNDQTQASVIWQVLADQKLSDRKALIKLVKDIGLGDVADMYDMLNRKEANDAFVKAGYDGVLSSLGNDENEYVVFKASQINIISIERPQSLGHTR